MPHEDYLQLLVGDGELSRRPWFLFAPKWVKIATQGVSMEMEGGMVIPQK